MAIAISVYKVFSKKISKKKAVTSYYTWKYNRISNFVLILIQNAVLKELRRTHTKTFDFAAYLKVYSKSLVFLVDFGSRKNGLFKAANRKFGCGMLWQNQNDEKKFNFFPFFRYFRHCLKYFQHLNIFYQCLKYVPFYPFIQLVFSHIFFFFDKVLFILYIKQV